MSGGSIRILWDESEPCEVTITGGIASWTVNSATATFPHTVSSSTTFTTSHAGTYTLSVKYAGMEIADTPDGVRTVELTNGEELIFSPSPDSTVGLVAGVDGIVASHVEDPTSATSGALSASYAALAEQARDVQALAAARSRDGAYKIDASAGMAALTSSSGLAFTSDYYNATVGGTDGTGIFPIWADISRVAFRVKVTKATANSQSYVGVCNTLPGAMPASNTPTFGVGYKAGVGICLIRENVGTDTVLVADSVLTDGWEYDISLVFDRAMTPSSAQASNLAHLAYRYAKSDGTGRNWGATSVNLGFWPNTRNWFVRTDVSAGGITNLTASAPVSGTGLGSASGGGNFFYSTTSGEDVFVRIPRNPNGMAVIALHGHGGGATTTGWTSASLDSVWLALEAAGYTIFAPKSGGNLWGNDTTLSLIQQLHTHIVEDFRLDPRVFLYGISMGGGQALTTIAKDAIPVRAAVLIDPVCDLAALWDNPSFTSLPAAYGDSTTERDDNNPMAVPVSDFAGVPLLFVAHSSDTVVSKAAHTDAMRTRLGSVVDHQLVTDGQISGGHGDASHFRPTDALGWFAANI